MTAKKKHPPLGIKRVGFCLGGAHGQSKAAPPHANKKTTKGPPPPPPFLLHTGIVFVFLWSTVTPGTKNWQVEKQFGNSSATRKRGN